MVRMARINFELSAPTLPRLQRSLRCLSSWLPPLNFITLHYGYFIVACLLGSLIIWASSTPLQSLAYIDALFLSVSAMTEAGLNTVNLSELNTFQQACLMIQIHVGSAIFVSAFTVRFRRHVFEQKFKNVIEQERRNEQARRERSQSRGRGRTFSLRAQSRDAAHQAEGPAEHKEGERESEGSEQVAIAANDVQVLPRSGSASRTPSHPMNKNVQDKPGTKSDSSLMHSPSRAVVHFGDKASDESGHATQLAVAAARSRRYSLFRAQGVGAGASASLQPMSPSRLGSGMMQLLPEVPEGTNPRIGQNFFLKAGWVSRNSEFHGLTDKERERLGGYEYRAMKLLSWLVPAYFYLWQLLGCLACGAWIANRRAETTLSNGLDPFWVGAFNAVSAFNNSGMSLLDANMTPFRDGYYLLLTMGLLILAGNTCYPIFLRLIVWTMLQYVKLHIKLFGDGSEIWTERANTIRFLLDHPRRCYTNLFPAPHTWWLLLVVITLNGTDWVAFEVLNIGSSYMKQFTTAERAVDGLFQAFAVRSGGFYVVAISSLRISLQVLYVVMMYISVYPVVITMRNSNVYEERSLGIYAEDQERHYYNGPPRAAGPQRPAGILRRLLRGFVPGAGGAGGGVDDAKGSNRIFLRQQIRAQLAHDAWTVVLALFLIMIVETGSFDADPAAFSVFNFIFEIVSAYGCVGLSVGLPDQAYSFAGSWHTLSKLLLCVVMLRGRHRGLPVAIDRAVLLPGEEAVRAEEDDGRIRLATSMGGHAPPEETREDV